MIKLIIADDEYFIRARLEKIISEKNIDLIIDASHPYAQNISKIVISMVSFLNERAKSEKKILKYIRFERKMLDYGSENVFKFENIKELVEFLNQFENKNILSTLGSNALEEIKGIREKNNLFIRILPTTSSIENAENLGYLPKNIIEYYKKTFRPGFKLADRDPYLNALFRGWVLVQYAKHFNEDIGPPHRPEYLLLYSDGDLDRSFIDWGEIIGVGSIEF